ncbi:MAG: 23S rRNA (adenine(2503)-C(2))-methyltransferase RlmN [Clostridia bacterium]|nr:23S rRNA (adenine(2503)-C(2))-methyltransferase RlmN [Clostridia bacterium]
MKHLLDCNLQELKEIVAAAGQPSFRAKQIFKWLCGGVGFDGMTDLPLAFRKRLAEEYTAQPLAIHEKFVSKDGSAKILYKLTDGNLIEGVYMPHFYGNTLCVSTQVGCRMGCAFCASGIGGLVRNLTAGEIAAQVVAVNAFLGGTVSERKISNLVLMGSGEPLDNYENVTKFLGLITASDGLNISMRSISLSTCGLAENIRRLADDGYGVTLSLSLHATTDEMRRELMPIASVYPMHEVIGAVKYYFQKTGRRVIYEYALIKGKNMTHFDCKRLAELTRGYPCHVNLIRLNYVKEKGLSGCTEAEAERFLQTLVGMNVSATIRRSFGNDVGGACGQLRRSYIEKR